MQFLKNFFKHDDKIIGLSGLKRKAEYVKINISENYKKTYMPNYNNNCLLF